MYVFICKLLEFYTEGLTNNYYRNKLTMCFLFILFGLQGQFLQENNYMKSLLWICQDFTKGRINSFDKTNFRNFFLNVYDMERKKSLITHEWQMDIGIINVTWITVMRYVHSLTSYLSPLSYMRRRYLRAYNMDFV